MPCENAGVLRRQSGRISHSLGQNPTSVERNPTWLASKWPRPARRFGAPPTWADLRQ